MAAIRPEPTFPILIIDTASPVTTLGLGLAGDDWLWVEDALESGIVLFAGIGRMLEERSIALEDIGAAAFCQGPGSMLGIRTAAMALRTWTATGCLPASGLWTYSSLALVASVRAQEDPEAAFTVAVDARRQSWHCLSSGSGAGRGPAIRRVPHAAVETLPPPVYLPDRFPVWNPRPQSWQTCPYPVRALESESIRRQILRPVSHPDACQPEVPFYQKWIPAISRAPGARPAPTNLRS